MEFTVSCSCGRVQTVSEGSAGARIACACGEMVDVPSLAQLRKQAGLSAVEVAVEFQIARLVETRELPPPSCIMCGSNSADQMSFAAICEQIYVQKSGGFSWFTLLCSLGNFMAWRPTEISMHGRNTIVPTPVSACDHCRRQLMHTSSQVFAALLALAGVVAMLMLSRQSGMIFFGLAFVAYFYSGWSNKHRQRALKQWLGQIPLYKQLFDKYPDTVLQLVPEGDVFEKYDSDPLPAPDISS